jgi:hypothetical protein
MGILSRCRLGQVAVHIGMRERVRPEDALTQDRCHQGLGVSDDVDLELIKEGQIFLRRFLKKNFLI